MAQDHGRRRLAEGKKIFFASIDQARRADPGHTLLTIGSSLVRAPPHAHGHDAHTPTAHGMHNSPQSLTFKPMHTALAALHSARTAPHTQLGGGLRAQVPCHLCHDPYGSSTTTCHIRASPSATLYATLCQTYCNAMPHCHLMQRSDHFVPPSHHRSPRHWPNSRTRTAR